MLGTKVKDRISGFEGIVVAETKWVYGCIRFGVSSQSLHEGKVKEVEWFDDGQLEVVEAPVEGIEPNMKEKSPGVPSLWFET